MRRLATPRIELRQMSSGTATKGFFGRSPQSLSVFELKCCVWSKGSICSAFIGWVTKGLNTDYFGYVTGKLDE